MSTRCNVKIDYRGSIRGQREHTIFYLYRHCDGYPAIVGQDILAFVDRINRAENLSLSPALAAVNFFLCDSPTDGVYELTDGCHGDIDYFYEIRIDSDIPGSRAKIFMAGPTSDLTSDHAYGTDLEFLCRHYSREMFVLYVNDERKGANRRIKKRYENKPEQYKRVFGEMKLYTMLT